MNNTKSIPIDEAFLRANLRVPGKSDQKYTRGVPLIATGSPTYPGAAVLGVRGAQAVGVGMVRYLGSSRSEDLILQCAPEVVMGGGRFQVALVGSGWDASMATVAERLARECAAAGLPLVVDAGALPAVREWSANNPHLVATPHLGEAEQMLAALGEDVGRARIEDEPEFYAHLLATKMQATIVLKAASTVVCSPYGPTFVFEAPCAWGATAGAGDVLAGVIAGTIAAALAPRHPAEARHPAAASSTKKGADAGQPTLKRSDYLPAVAAGVGLHGLAAARASGVLNADLTPSSGYGHPIVAGDIALSIPEVFGEILRAPAS